MFYIMDWLSRDVIGGGGGGTNEVPTYKTKRQLRPIRVYTICIRLGCMYLYRRGRRGGGGGEGANLFTCSYPQMVQARPPKDQKPALPKWHPVAYQFFVLGCR